MKIGDFAKQFQISAHAVRYYINLGLLVPTSRNSQFVFDENDVYDMQEILKLKKMRFSIKEIHHILSLKRISNFSNTNDANDYIEVLKNKKKELLNEQIALKESIDDVNGEIRASQHKANHAVSKSGVPISVMQYLYCPYCQKSLNFSNVFIDNQQILKGDLTCDCNYTATIKDGVLITGDSEISPYDYPDLERKCYKDLTPVTVSLFQKSYKWIISRLSTINCTGKLILESHVNAFCFLYTNFEQLDKDAIYVIVDNFPEILCMYKEKIDSLSLGLNVLYIVNSSSKYPLKHGCLDIHLDYFSTNEYSLFHENRHLSPDILPYFKDKSYFLGTFFFLDANAKSLVNLRKDFPQTSKDAFNQVKFKEQIESLPFTLIGEEFTGFAVNSGNNHPFPLSVKGEKIGLYSFYYTRT